MVRFELTTSTSRTWRANRAALHPALFWECKDRIFIGLVYQFLIKKFECRSWQWFILKLPGIIFFRCGSATGTLLRPALRRDSVRVPRSLRHNWCLKNQNTRCRISDLSWCGPAKGGIPRIRQPAETREAPGSVAVRQRKIISPSRPKKLDS